MDVEDAEGAEQAASRTRDEVRRQDERWRTHLAALQDAHAADLGASEALRAAQTRADRRLIDAAQAIVGSRRWALARQLGLLPDRLRRLDPARAEDRLHERAAAAEAAASAPTPAPTPVTVAPPEAPAGAEPAAVRAPFVDHDGYLITATTQPLLPLTGDEPTRRVLGVMDSLRRAAVREVEAAGDGQPAVTVVCITDGPAAGLDAALAGVAAQTHPDVRVLLAGPGAEVVATRHASERLHLEVVAGTGDADAATARTAALAAVTTPVVAHLDARTVWHPDLLRVLVHELGRLPGPGVAYAAQELRTPDGSRDSSSAGSPDPGRPVSLRFAPYNRALLEQRGYVALSTVVHHAALLAEVAAPDPALGELASWDLVLQLTAAGPVAAVPCLLSSVAVTLPGSAAEPIRIDDLLDDDADRDAELAALAVLDDRHLGAPLALSGTEALFPTGHTPRAVAPALRRHGRPRPTSVVIPSYEAPEELAMCLAALAATCDPADVEVVVVDNASSTPTLEVLEAAASQGRIRLLRNDRNLGFTSAVNRGIAAAGDRDVVLLNNDAVVTPGWLDGLWDVLDRVDDAGLVVPRQVLPPGSPAARSHVPAVDIQRECDVNLSALHRNVRLPDPDLPSGLHALTWAPFFAVYVPRATIDALGPLNVEHGPHYRSDRLYCDTVRHRLAQRIVATPASKLYHLRRRSTRTLKRRDPALYEAMYLRNDWRAISGGAGDATDGAPDG